jgi:uncharacterized protein (DUF1501 family)
MADGGRNDAHLAALDMSAERATRLRASTALDQLTLGRATDFADQCALAVDALSSSLCASVVLDTELDWDTHDENVDQHANFEATFAGLSGLLEGLEAAGILDDTSVLVLSEMSRTPLQNDSAGKDHWPVTSALLIGADVDGGRTCGGTDSQLDALGIDLQTGLVSTSGTPLTYAQLAAGVLEGMSVDPAEWLPGVEIFRGFRA